MEDNVRKSCVCVCVYVDWVTLLYSGKLTEHCKPTIMEKIKIIKKISDRLKDIENRLVVSKGREWDALGVNWDFCG